MPTPQELKVVCGWEAALWGDEGGSIACLPSFARKSLKIRESPVFLLIFLIQPNPLNPVSLLQ
ncbi:hypothetical protein C7B76_17625 [filamentous cyanobacterium CCP2]|nr:hypothetical protein C7B76_17625 [filamentous cyanobacterium CCP2]